MYTVGRVLGQGGFGITYLGGDIRARRPVAIKEFFPYGSTRRGVTVHPFGGLTAADFASTRTKFLDEASILARFDHPAIVDVYGTFAENNTAYMVMELLRGKTLGQLIEEGGPMPESQAIRHIIRAGEALEVVHATNLLHRDLKPDNLMLNDAGDVVLIDFGTARTYAAGKTGRMTTMVTPGYAPLEQYGEHVRFGPFTDVYALGATLYHLLTGLMPPSATDRASGVDLDPPAQVNPSVGAGVNDAVMWAMKMRVADRPQRVADFLDPLRSAATSPEPPPTTVPEPADESLPHRPTWRPPVPYDGPYDLEVGGEDVRWPRRCACCFEPSDTALLIEHTGNGGFLGLFSETREWEVPYCSQCAQHIQLEHSAPGGNLGGAIAGALIGGPLGLLVGLGSAAVSLFGAAQYQEKLEGLLRPTCAAVGVAVAYRGWYQDVHAFTFLNRAYAEAFQRENAGIRVG
jgi:serine/threonine protein kinase